MDQRLQTESLPAVRGNITAANGQALAITVETYLVYADPVMMSAAQLPEVAADLAGPLGMTEPDILSLLQHPTSPQYVVLKKNVSQQTADQIKALKLPGATGTGGTGTTTTGSGLPGVQLQASYSRVYPDGDATSNLLGFTHPTASGNLTGAAGLEYSDNALLAGRAGQRAVPGRHARRADPAGRGQEHADRQRERAPPDDHPRRCSGKPSRPANSRCGRATRTTARS